MVCIDLIKTIFSFSTIRNVGIAESDKKRELHVDDNDNFNSKDQRFHRNFKKTDENVDYLKNHNQNKVSLISIIVKYMHKVIFSNTDHVDPLGYKYY